jgi:hypothetical protein
MISRKIHHSRRLVSTLCYSGRHTRLYDVGRLVLRDDLITEHNIRVGELRAIDNDRPGLDPVD